MARLQDGTALEPKENVRYLGVWLNRKLSAGKHVEVWAAKAIRVAQHVRSLYTTKRGLPPAAAAKAVQAYVYSKAIYSADV